MTTVRTITTIVGLVGCAPRTNATTDDDGSFVVGTTGTEQDDDDSVETGTGTYDTSLDTDDTDTTPVGPPQVPWRLLATGENYDYFTHLKVAGVCDDLEADIIGSSEALQKWVAAKSAFVADDVDWAIELVVAASAMCKYLGNSAGIAGATDGGGGALALDYEIAHDSEFSDTQSLLWHVVAVEGTAWTTVLVTDTESGP